MGKGENTARDPLGGKAKYFVKCKLLVTAKRRPDGSHVEKEREIKVFSHFCFPDNQLISKFETNMIDVNFTNVQNMKKIVFEMNQKLGVKQQ